MLWLIASVGIATYLAKSEITGQKLARRAPFCVARKIIGETIMHRKATSRHKFAITVFMVWVCVQRNRGGCKDCYHGCPALHCRAGPLAPGGNSPLAEAIEFCSVPCGCFPDLHLYYHTCSPLQAQS